MIPGLAMAHDPGLSGIRIILNSGNYVVSVTTHISRLLKADHLTGNPKDPELVSALSNRLKLKVDGKSYRSTDRHLILDRANDMIILQSTASGTPKNLGIRSEDLS